jgi:hypothetical protein
MSEAPDNERPERVVIRVRFPKAILSDAHEGRWRLHEIIQKHGGREIDPRVRSKDDPEHAHTFEFRSALMGQNAKTILSSCFWQLDDTLRHLITPYPGAGYHLEMRKEVG